MNCKFCNTPNARDCDKQKGVHLPTRRYFTYTIWQCDDGCGSSFAFDSDKRFIDDGSPVPAKCEVPA
jgi:hypothetical protein